MCLFNEWMEVGEFIMRKLILNLLTFVFVLSFNGTVGYAESEEKKFPIH